MTTYILLRDNKESQPLSLADLKNTGLRPADLVWVEGQSVCWMSPGQVEELKEIPVEAAAVEQKIKEEDYSYSPKEKTQAIFPRWQIPPQVKKIGFYAGLFVVGLTVGLILSKKLTKGSPITKIESQHKSGVDIPQQVLPVSDSAASSATLLVKDDQATEPDPINEKEQLKSKSPFPLKENKTVNGTVSANDKPVIQEPVVAGSEMAEQEKSKEHPDEKEARKPSIKEIYSQVSVKNNDYSVGSFGGIKNLELTVSNHSKYVLDEVEVQVQYFKPMNEFLKSEKISLHSIPPGGSKTIQVKNSNRGVKVSCKVSGIKSNDFTDTAGL